MSQRNLAMLAYRRGSYILPEFIALIGLLNASPLAIAADKSPQRWAMLIGVDEYAYVHQLKYCVADQEALAKQLIDSGFPADQVFVLDDQAKQERFHPFKSNIDAQLELVLGMVHKGDTLVVSFSGHGISAKDGKSYLLPIDARLTDPAGTMISVDKVYDQLSACPAGLKLMMVDACRNDPFAEDEKRGVGLDPDKSTRGLVAALEKPPEGISLLMSCGRDQFAREDSDLGHGVFIHFILEGLSGKAADDDGVVSLMRLADYASRSTEKYVHKKFNAPQTPFFRGDVAGTVELARVDRMRLRPESAPIKQREAITNSIGMKLTLVPAGEFMMGSNETTQQLRDAGFSLVEGKDINSESPRHRVHITQPFLMGTYAVTFGQFRQFVAETGYVTETETGKDGQGGTGSIADKKKTTTMDFDRQFNWRNTGWTQTDEHPVVNVTWNDAQAFCDWLSKKEIKSYRLPTEAQREYACRAGTTTRFWTGDSPGSLTGAANVWDQSAKEKLPNVNVPIFNFNDGWPFTAPVGRFKSNSFGLFDMTGNVWEWCQDWFEKDYYATSAADDPKDPESGFYRVTRGCGWDARPVTARVANRGGRTPTARLSNLGFRVVCEP
jgi:formylglycine-generating enzyme